MSGRRIVIVVAAVGCLLATAPMVLLSAKPLVFNATSSVPIGFYWLGDRQPRAGDLALVRPPHDLARWMAARRYLPMNVPLIKRIAAVNGQFVCVRAGVVTVDGVRLGEVLRRDRVGRSLTASSVCRRLAADEVFLLNTTPRSLDSRYFGPLPRRCVVGRLTPLWTWAR
jgi:conjugative transfer signal peptidase TraF